MKYVWLLVLVCCLLAPACKSKKKPVETTENDIQLVTLYEEPVLPPDSSDLDFTILDAIAYTDSVQVRIRYGGGCVKPHVFEMYTSAVPDTTGVINLYLMHKTHNDRCRALVFTQRTFLWSHLLKPGQKVSINNRSIITIP